mmetsp:Transcript_10753/g.25328  ORF Transcript_10753/g.25328 Transcript_10753/m.25328 type:complete len:264 (+) Transcript_10753:52-843(+)
MVYDTLVLRLRPPGTGLTGRSLVSSLSGVRQHRTPLLPAWTRSTSCLREAHNARRRDAQVEVDLVVGWLDRQAGDERDRAEGDDDEAGAGGDVHVLDVHGEAGGRAELRGVVGERVLRLGHADGQHTQRGVALVLRDARLGSLRVAGALAAVCALDDGFDLLLDALRRRVVQVLEATGAVGGRVGARRHHSATERRRARASMRKVRRLHRVVRATLHGDSRHQRHLRVRVRVEAVHRDDHRDAVVAHVTDVCEQVDGARLDQR